MMWSITFHGKQFFLLYVETEIDNTALYMVYFTLE
jgi:hypothetical protein